MIHQFITLFLRRTHFWRVVGFKELTELYVSRMLRVMAMQMMAGFTTIYLYQLGYSLLYIFLAWFIYFVARALCIPLAALLIARYGPKHSTLISNLALIVATLGMIMVPEYKIWGFVIYIIFGSFSRSLYDISYLVDFSKIKHIDNAGKEIGLMQVIERITTVIAPLLGGIVALFFGPRAMLVFGCILMALAAMPLFFSAEPVRTKQRITLRHFNIKATWRSFIASIGIGVDNSITGMLWAVFVAIMILDGKNQAVFAQVGALGAFSAIVSIVSAYWFGHIIDNRHGKKLLRFGAIGNMLLHMIRPFITSPAGVVTVNTMNEAATTAYTLTATRSVFDLADGLPGYRIVYMSLLSFAMVLGDILVTLFVCLAISVLGDKPGIQFTMWVWAPAMLVILWHGRALYRRGVFTRFIHRV
jgi:MFS family permease